MNAAPSSRVSEQSERNRRAVYRFSDEAITPGNFDSLDELVAPDYVIHGPLGELDLESLKAIMRPLRNAFTDFKMTREQVLVEQDYASARTMFTGVFEHEYHSPNGVIPPNGKDFALPVINVFRFNAEGRIAEEWFQFDNLSFLTQLGAMSPP
jgi:predicted ester cyclase